MANYLPVLLVSVTTNNIPDDSSLTTQATAQVDYLSHDWQEEDVWRSWRNMTRQKKEIANGIRLENASWRTWWKQRNKLKTISPETLNWLKDSDVTWLYGPLHTASTWAPPPKQPSPAQDRLDLSTTPKPQKPILKHRSISELLTSDRPPTSPVFSPNESEDENPPPSASNSKPRRPLLPHTKSDTHITRWSSHRELRKDSPPRINPPGLPSLPPRNDAPLSAGGSLRPSLSQDSNSSTGGSASTSGGEKPKKRHISFNTFVEQCIAIEKPKKTPSGFFGVREESAWMGRGTYVDEAGYEEDQEDDEDEDEDLYELTWEQRRSLGTCVIRDDSDDEKNEEEDDGIIEMRSSSHRNTFKKKPLPRSQSQVSTTSSSSSASTSTTSSQSADSVETNSTSSPGSSLSPSRKSLHRKPSSASSTASTATARPEIPRRHSHTSSRRGPPPPLYRKTSEHVHVTIAPIAPTILKTGGWSEGFGDECISDDGLTGWLNSIAGGNVPSGRARTNGSGAFGTGKVARRRDEDAQGSSEGTPVELVYVPPFGSNYSLGLGEYEEPAVADDDEIHGELDEEPQLGNESLSLSSPGVYHHPATTTASVGFVNGTSSSLPSGSAPIPITSSHSQESDSSVPTVVLDRSPKRGSDVRNDDPYDYFGGPDMGEDYYSARRGGRGYERSSYTSSSKTNGRERERQRERQQTNGGERQSRSRSRSQSRTPSPAMTGVLPKVDEKNISTSTSPSSSSLTRNGSSSNVISPSGSRAELLSPPPTNRSRSHHDTSTTSVSTPNSSTSPSGYSRPQPQIQTRGRSNTRGSSSSSWDRSVSVGSSPMGSLSPDGSNNVGINNVLNVGSVLAGGRGPREKDDRNFKERERGADKEKDSERGRERRGRERVSSRVAASGETETGSSKAGSAPTIASTPISEPTFSRETSRSSNSNTTVTPGQSEARPGVDELRMQHEAELEYAHMAEEDLRRQVHPTPSNSPVVGMRRAPPAKMKDEPSVEQFEESDGSTTTPVGSGGCSSAGMTTPTTVSVGSSPKMDGTSSASTPISPPISTSTSTITARTPSSSTIPSPSTLSPSKMRPPLIPTPSLPVKPSTSFIGVSSPVKPASPSRRPLSPGRSDSEERRNGHTIVGKAVDMVNTAGVYLGFWQHANESA